MAEQLLAELPPQNPNFASEFDEFFNFDNGELDSINFDDIELTFDDMGDLYFPDENEQFIFPELDHAVNGDAFRSGYRETDSGGDLVAAESGSSEVSGDRGGSDAGKFLNSDSSENRSYGEDAGLPEVGCGAVSSRGSGFSEMANVSSPDSGDRGVVEQKVKVEELGKRKKGEDDGSNGELRSSKSRRSGGTGENGNAVSNSGCGWSEAEEKKKARLLRNRESAQMSRQRKKQHVNELEEKVRSMNSVIVDLNNRISYVMAENANLRQQLSGNGLCPPPPPPGMYPPHPQMGSMYYPWMPYGPYAVKPQGSQVPLVPIPRLKPQQFVSSSKPKKSESKKSGEGKTKKVASITFLGLLFFILLFGGLVPMVNLKFSGSTNRVPSFGSEFYDQHRGRVLTVDGHSNDTDLNVGLRCSNKKFDINDRIHHCGGTGNSSEQLVASLYVPRNDKLVKIDGNLIIHSVLASEEAIASQVNSEANKREETGLAIRNELAAALAIPEVGNNRGKYPNAYRNLTERRRALSSGSIDSLKDQTKSSVDGRLQKWFSEGLAGTMLSSGMCTEVFQFDISPTSPGAIIPASAASDVSAENRQNSSHPYKGGNRRILQGVPVSLPGSTSNFTEEQVRKASPGESFQGNKSGSSVVVSVLVDPREAGDGNSDDSMVAPRSLSRIFIVVLLDSVKYVTYSCVLPRVAPHLVAA